MRTSSEGNLRIGDQIDQDTFAAKQTQPRDRPAKIKAAT